MNMIQPLWYGKPYYSLDAYCKNTYHEKLYKIALNAGLTCPNRDGTLDTRGCIFCSGEGSGDFSKRITAESDFSKIIEYSLSQIHNKKTGNRYIAYFQSFTNTYGPVKYLERIYRLALEHPDVAGISIATRPDCLSEEILQLLSALPKEYPDKFIWVELGLQSIHGKTAQFIRRGYSLSCFEQAVSDLTDIGIPAIVHIILGLPGESVSQQLETISYLNTLPIQGIKLQLLHLLKDTDLGILYEQEPERYHSYESMEEYLAVLISCLEHLRPDIVIHRLTGDAPKDLLLSPEWSLHKRTVLNTLHHLMKQQSTYQGRLYVP